VSNARRINALDVAPIILGSLGLFIAGILSYSHYAKLIPPCGGSHGCAIVQTSPFAFWGGVPVAYYGLIGYLLIFAIASIRPFVVGRGQVLATKLGLLVTGIGTLASAMLIFLAIFELGEICFWCFGSAAVMTATCIVFGFLSSREEEIDGGSAYIGPIIFGLILAAGLFGGSLSQLTSGATEVDPGITQEQLLPVSSKILHGDPVKDLILIEFGDVNCPACRHTHTMISELVELNKDKMSYSFRHMPLAHLPGHETSAQDARVKDVDQLIKIAAEIGLNTTGLDERIKSAESSLFASMTLDTSVAIDAGITQTPTFILIMKGHPTKAATAASMARLLGQEPYKSYLSK
jgi:uncharacterized membrane protein